MSFGSFVSSAFHSVEHAVQKVAQPVEKLTGTVSLNKALFAPTKKNLQAAATSKPLIAGAVVGTGIAAAPIIGSATSAEVAGVGSVVKSASGLVSTRGGDGGGGGGVVQQTQAPTDYTSYLQIGGIVVVIILIIILVVRMK